MDPSAMETLIREVINLFEDQSLSETERIEVIKMLTAGNTPADVANRIKQKRQQRNGVNVKGHKQ